MMEKHILRALILETISKSQITQINEVVGDVERKVKSRNLFPSKEDCERNGVNYHDYEQKTLNRKDTLTISEIIWDLIQERIITPGNSNADENFPLIRLTTFGQEFISKSPPHYYDPEGYLKYLNEIIPSLDPIIEQYLFESLNCYKQQLYFASAVMIGAASEKAVLLLLQAIHDSETNQSNKNKVSKLLDRPNLPEIFDTITRTVRSLIQSDVIPYSTHRGSIEHLMSLFEMVRVQRNDSIHPIGGKVDKTKVFLSLQTIPTALESINGLIRWFRSNRIP